jgi:preprotein translocase subunit YajC
MTVAIIYFVVLIALFFVLIVVPQRRRSAAQRAFVQSLQVGDEVFTNGGILGTITAVDDQMVDLEVAPGVVLRVARIAIAQPGPSAEDDADTDGANDANDTAGSPPAED